MKVIKLGGSLMGETDTLTACLNTIEQNSNDKVVIVPGGGLFADQVRNAQKQWLINDEIAHEMAILAMQQMALLFKSIKPVFLLAKHLLNIDNRAAVFIWSPDITELNNSSIEASWNVTSDSLAAWLAAQLNADELILVKSAEIPVNLSIHQMQKQGLIDAAFTQYIKDTSYKITLLNKNSFNEHAFT